MRKRLTEVRVLWRGELVRVTTVSNKGDVDLPACEGVSYEVCDVDVVRAERAPVVERRTLVPIAASIFAHVGVLAGIAFIAPKFTDDDVEVHRDHILAMRHILESRDDAPMRTLEDDMRDDSGNTEGGTGAGAKGAQGAMGSPVAAHAFARFGIQGFKDNPSPTTSREAALSEAATFGIIGLIPTSSDSNAPATDWGRATNGNDATNAQGNLWGDAVADAFGVAGLGLSGCGCDGAGGRGEGIGIGTIGTIGHGLGHGIGGGVGSGHGHLDGGHTPGPPFLRSGATTVNGRLPPETIQHVVRQNFGRFRACYADALRASPSLEGRVVVKFVIGRDGSVDSAADGGSDIPSNVSECVVRRFGDLSFPEPSGGVVTVVYPLVFTSG
jgi:hypothetical protein